MRDYEVGMTEQVQEYMVGYYREFPLVHPTKSEGVVGR